jgi:hypothetical protein
MAYLLSVSPSAMATASSVRASVPLLERMSEPSTAGYSKATRSARPSEAPQCAV